MKSDHLSSAACSISSALLWSLLPYLSDDYKSYDDRKKRRWNLSQSGVPHCPYLESPTQNPATTRDDYCEEDAGINGEDDYKPLIRGVVGNQF